MAIVYLTLGSNINPEENLRAALTLLKEHAALLAYSSVYITPPQGYTQQPDFYNMAAKVETSLA
ncbi:MAG: 2-amino-4-hydroxy-6-hydroxymethyldihydropteridine diphosphokinase, partial [Phototrophicales bacterium]